jgi:hypothetical protein
MTRPPEPAHVIQWREWLKAGPPRCCHTCEHYGIDGLCVAFFRTPPEEFAATMNACEEWEAEVPF